MMKGAGEVCGGRSGRTNPPGGVEALDNRPRCRLAVVPAAG